MAFRIPGTNIKIGKDKKESAKNAALAAAYKRVLATGSGSDKVEWPEMEAGVDSWYSPDAGAGRRATAEALMRDAEAQIPGGAPDYRLVFDHPDQESFGPGGPRAFSSSAGLVNMPSDIEGYMSKPQYLASVLAHEVAHNADWVKNKPKVGHNKETFRPLEKAASRAAMIEPEYFPGDDVGIGGVNEYPDIMKSLGPYKQKYFVSNDVQDQTRGLQQVDPMEFLSNIIRKRKDFASSVGKTHRGVSNRETRASLT